MRQRRWVQLLVDYDCDINYHPGKENMVADALVHEEPRVSYHLKCMEMVVTLVYLSIYRLLSLRV